MAWTTYQCIIAALLVFAGTFNTLLAKWANQMMAVGADGKDERNFNHPFFQAWAMFLGELLCMFTFYGLYYYWKKRDKHDEHKLVKGNRSYNPLFLLPSAMCDMIASSVMYVGLVFTYASSYEMLRGAVIIFVGIFSILFLGRKLVAREWCGIVLVIFGLGLVGLSDFIIHSHSDQDESNSDIDKQYNIVEVIFGDVLIVSAQVVAATQFILEEKFVSSLDIPPLQAVGWEGLFGVIVLGILLIPFYYIKVPDSFSINSRGVLEDIPDAFIQMGNNPLIIMPLSFLLVSIAFFNFAGISVTKEMSATTRMVLNSLRTLFIWMVSLVLEWQKFHWVQVIGFLVLILGIALYNDVFVMQAIHKLNNCIRHLRNRGAESTTEPPTNESNLPTSAIGDESTE